MCWAREHAGVWGGGVATLGQAAVNRCQPKWARDLEEREGEREKCGWANPLIYAWVVLHHRYLHLNWCFRYLIKDEDWALLVGGGLFLIFLLLSRVHRLLTGTCSTFPETRQHYFTGGQSVTMHPFFFFSSMVIFSGCIIEYTMPPGGLWRSAAACVTHAHVPFTQRARWKKKKKKKLLCFVL